jgi:glycosyltransferase involved in cell wall biosynthesis
MAEISLSICIPTYNRASSLDVCLGSIISQLAPEIPIRIIVCDNASTDHTAQIVEKWTAKRADLVYCRNATNIGGIANFWAVSSLVDTEYFWFMGDDSFPVYGAIEHVLQTLNRRSDIDFLFLAGTNNVADQSDRVRELLEANDGETFVADSASDFLANFWLQDLGCISYLVFRSAVWKSLPYNFRYELELYPQIRCILEMANRHLTMAFSNRLCVINARASIGHNSWYIHTNAIAVTYEFPQLQKLGLKLGVPLRGSYGFFKSYRRWRLEQWVRLVLSHPYYKSFYRSIIGHEPSAILRTIYVCSLPLLLLMAPLLRKTVFRRFEFFHIRSPLPTEAIRPDWKK